MTSCVGHEERDQNDVDYRPAGSEEAGTMGHKSVRGASDYGGCDDPGCM